MVGGQESTNEYRLQNLSIFLKNLHITYYYCKTRRVTRFLKTFQNHVFNCISKTRRVKRCLQHLEHANRLCLSNGQGLCLVNIKGSVGLILTKTSVTCEDFHTRTLICHLGSLSLYRASFDLGDLQHFWLLPLSVLLCVLSKRRMMGYYLRVLPAFLILHSFSVTFFYPRVSLFLIQLQINTQSLTVRQPSPASD